MPVQAYLGNPYANQKTLSDYMRADRSLNSEIASREQGMAMNDQKMKQARAAELVNMVSPDGSNYGAIRQQAISEGIGTEQTIPAVWDENTKAWLDNLRARSGQADPGGTRAAQAKMLMQDNPKMTFTEAYAMTSPLLGQGLMLQGDELVARMGAPEAKGAIKYGETMGSQQAKLETEPAIAGGKRSAEAQVDLATKPAIEYATSVAAKSGTEAGEKEATLRANMAVLPQLEETVQRLSELGKKATYTMAGRAVDAARREAGADPREGAVARAEYISLVDNQILPLLRQTFGAQFTQKEGESLKITLGDPNKSPEEKDAVLRSFIQQKKANIESLKREMNLDTIVPSNIPDTPMEAPMEGAKQAPDGQWYVPDPDRPGKWMKVE